jgi:hypothetical protein
MNQKNPLPASRRAFLIGAGLALLAPQAAMAFTSSDTTQLPNGLMRRALASLDQHRSSITARDRIGIADFSQASRDPRFHIVELSSGRTRTFLVAHGRGSDPDHSGWVERFSNVEGSQASSSGTYVTGDEYVGQHGRSRRLSGLDWTNNNAERRGIVIHAASYVGPNVVATQGKLGRSEGCFAFSSSDIDFVLAALGPGRLLYADRMSV